MTRTGINFRHPIKDDAQMLLDWRRDPSVEQFMYTQIDNDINKQREWLLSCTERNDFEHFIICWKDRPIGYLNYHINQQHKRASSGSYMVHEKDRKKFGGLMHTYFMDYLFFGLGMNKAVAEIMANNAALVKIQRILKLREVGTFQQHIWKDGSFHDVILFELLKSDYEQHPRQQTIEKSLGAFKEAD